MPLTPVPGTLHVPASGSRQGESRTLIVRPNFAYINRLRFPLPPLTPAMRPHDIRRIALLDDAKIVILSLPRVLEEHFRTEGIWGTTITQASVSLSEEALRGREPEIVTAQSVEQIGFLAGNLARLRFDLVFVDFNMQRTTGDSVIRKARSDGYSGFFVGLTADDEANRDQFIRAGADLVLPKPWNNDDIRNMLSVEPQPEA